MLNSNKLEEVFNLSPLVIEGEYTVEGRELTTTKSNVPTIVAESGKLDDSEYIRRNLKELADSTQGALELALQMQSDDPNARNTEAVAKMADAVAKALGNLTHLNKTEKDELYRSEPQAPQVINNNLTIMTTEEIIAKIINQTKQLKEK